MCTSVLVGYLNNYWIISIRFLRELLFTQSACIHAELSHLKSKFTVKLN